MGLVGCKLFFSVINWYEDAPFFFFFTSEVFFGDNLICKILNYYQSF